MVTNYTTLHFLSGLYRPEKGCVADDVCVCVLAFIYNCSPEDRLPGTTHIGVNIAETAVSQDFLFSLSGK